MSHLSHVPSGCDFTGFEGQSQGALNRGVGLVYVHIPILDSRGCNSLPGDQQDIEFLNFMFLGFWD